MQEDWLSCNIEAFHIITLFLYSIYLPMGRWPVVAWQKEASSQARAKAYTIHSKLIALAAQKWADTHTNMALAHAIEDARKASVPNDTIERAIRRWAWLDKDAKIVEEIFYEWYAPGGIGIIVQALTDNKNRTAPSMRHIFSAYGGNLWETWSVSNFLFEFKWIIRIDSNGIDELKFEENILETHAEDYSKNDQTFEIITDKTMLSVVKKELETLWYILLQSWLEYKAKNYIEVTDFDKGLKIYKMLEELSDNEDVASVWNNADMAEPFLQELTSFVESHRFRT